jgi:uroporphyrinogen III methyltransferase/synthase
MGRDKQGKVYLVGAGPGDPGLLTIKAKECLEQADVVIYDYLANEAFLRFAGEKAELIYVGKKGGAHTMPQKDINQLILDKVREGHVVVRLKGGDPFIFGRGGEEAQELARRGLSFEVIPGVTSAIAVPAYAGIPLTHRDHTATVAFITGHEDPTKETSNIAWDKLATGAGTLVFLMGVGNLPNIVKNLVQHGRSPDTPVAVIHRGTVPAQKTVSGRLQDIAQKVKEQGLRPPAVIVVGDVVELRKELNWFESKPLYGKRIVVTRAREQSSEFLAGLREWGAECIEFPTIQVVPPRTWEPLDQVFRRLEKYQWVVFTSVNGVKYFFDRLEGSGFDMRELRDMKVGAIGPKTAEAVARKGIRADLVPDEYRAEAVVEAFKDFDIKMARILLPRASEAREVLPVALTKMGAIVDEIPVYQTIRPLHDKARVKEMLEKEEIDMVTFTSSSTVTNFVDMFRQEARLLQEWMSKVTVACIGPITAKTAEDRGLSVSLMPEEYTIDALTHAIVQYFENA